jgi:hypothetical protein
LRRVAGYLGPIMFSHALPRNSFSSRSIWDIHCLNIRPLAISEAAVDVPARCRLPDQDLLASPRTLQPTRCRSVQGKQVVVPQFELRCVENVLLACEIVELLVNGECILHRVRSCVGENPILQVKHARAVPGVHGVKHRSVGVWNRCEL